MKLSSLRFDSFPNSWATALEMAHEYLPGDGVTYEHRYNAMMERRLLAILLLAAGRDGRKDFAYVQELAQKLDNSPVVFAETLRHPETPEANLALEQVLRAIGSLFCEPTKQLLLSLKNLPLKPR
jgi:hypothetical protein